MSWSRFDDKADECPKMRRAMREVGDAAWTMWSRAILFANRHETDGAIDEADLAGLTSARDWQKVRDCLLKHGLFEPRDGGVQVHDFLDWNESREQVRNKREAAKERMKRSRSPNVRANNERTDGEQTENFARSSHAVRSPSPLLSSPIQIEELTHSRAREPEPPTAERGPISPQGVTLLAEIRKHPALAPIATATVADKLVGELISGRPMATLLQAIGDAAREATSQDAVGASFDASKLSSTLWRFIHGAARSGGARPPARTAPTGQAAQPIVPEGTGWKKDLEERQRAHIAAMIDAAGDDAPL